MGRQFVTEQITIAAGKEEPYFGEFDFLRIKSISGATSVFVAIGDNGGLFEEMAAGRRAKRNNPVDRATFKNPTVAPITVYFLALLGSEDDEGNITLASGAVVKIDDAAPVSIYPKKSAGSTIKGTLAGAASAVLTVTLGTLIKNSGPEMLGVKLGGGSDYMTIGIGQVFSCPFDGSLSVKNMGSLSSNYVRMT